MNIHDMTRELANAIKNSEEYEQYMAAKDEVNQNEEVTKMVNDFQEKQFEMQRKQMMGENLGPDVMEQVQSLYSILMTDPLAAKYVQAEMRFSLMVNDVYTILGEVIKTNDQN